MFLLFYVTYKLRIGGEIPPDEDSGWNAEGATPYNEGGNSQAKGP